MMKVNDFLLRLIYFVFFCLLLLFVDSQDIEQFVPQIGRTFCKYLAHRQILPRHFIRQCAEPICTWADWQEALSNISMIPSQLTVEESSNFLSTHRHKYRIVLSYGHNGFGNQLWQHSVAFMIASNMKARLLIAMIPDNLSPGGYLPPNTMAGMSAMERLLPDDFEFEALPPSSYIRSLCDSEPFFISDRPFDWRDRNYSSNFRQNVYSLLSDPNPRCIKFIGYFQNLPLCDDDVRHLWTDRLLGNFTLRPGPNDLSIYLRCLPRHYHFNDKHFYETILNNTHFDQVWLFMAPECPTKLSNNPAKDGVVAAVVRLLMERYGAKRWPQYAGADDTTALLHDLAGLTSSKKLVLPLSSWAFWAGLFSNATEIHVNAPPLHPLMDQRPEYVYHSDRGQAYFGRYNKTTNTVEYALTTEKVRLEIFPLKSHLPQEKHHVGHERTHHSSNHHNASEAGSHNQHTANSSSSLSQ